MSVMAITMIQPLSSQLMQKFTTTMHLSAAMIFMYLKALTVHPSPSAKSAKVGPLDGDPDCTDAITGWFDDSEGNRWEAHDAPLHVSEFTNFNDAGIATISGLTALKAAHPYLTPEIEPGDPDVPSSDWPISKSKTAENLDENFESKVTLSLPADSYKPSVDVVMVMDVSSSMKGEDITEAKAAATAMCDELASKTNANVNIGIVTFVKRLVT